MAQNPPAQRETWSSEPRPWGWHDALAISVWTAAIAVIFWKAVTLRQALFYFDITEINFPYRDFLARELRAGRFSRWCPGLYCGFPLFSESQAGYLHPLKYLLYPWLETWKAFNLDTILSVWITGAATYGWLRRHTSSIGALTGAAVFGLSGFLWAHLIHTSMTNALASVPLAFWALEAAWARGTWRCAVLGALALACQVFAGHLQDALLTGMALGLYGVYRAGIEPARAQRGFVLGTTFGLLALGVLLSAVQWIPSKELLDRSPRAQGLSWDDLTYGSWHPELLPTLLVREAYGTRARDTDWMDGFYPYHEMNIYMGVTGLGLALLGAAAARDRWVGFWVLLAVLGSVLMLGKFTFLFDRMNRLPILGSSRIPVRYHLWVSLAVGALAAVGADRLARPGTVRLRTPLLVLGVMALVSIPILVHIYWPVWADPYRWTKPNHLARFRWLGQELSWAVLRTGLIALGAWLAARSAARCTDARMRSRIAAWLPVFVLADLIGAHWNDVPTIDPRYWTQPPPSAVWIQRDPTHFRVFGAPDKSAGEPGYASEQVDFFSVRDTLGWSLPPVWGLRSVIGETPIIPLRLLAYTDNARAGGGRFDIEGVTHLLTAARGDRLLGMRPPVLIGAAAIHRNPNALDRVRLVGRPIYVASRQEGSRGLRTLGSAYGDHVLVEDPDRPLPPGAAVSGTARILHEEPERLDIATEAAMPSYLFVADTFDPGWSAKVDGRPVPIRPAFVAFRAVYLPAGAHRVVFRYEPAGFRVGLGLALGGLALGLALLVWAPRRMPLGPEHGDAAWPPSWPRWVLGAAIAIVAASAIHAGPDGVRIHSRWRGSFHQFTWGSGIQAIRPPKPPVE